VSDTVRNGWGVLWDMDGTLVDTEPYWIATEHELVESFGGTWSDAHAHHLVGFDLMEGGRYIAEHGPVPLEPIEIVERLLDGVIRRVREHIPWRPGAPELLADLKAAGVPCCLVTMSWRSFADPVLAALPADSFVTAITGDEVPTGRGKPHPEPYMMGAAALGLGPEHCVAIEDSPTGARSALAAGCGAVLGVPNVASLAGVDGLVLRDTLEGLTVADLAELVAPRVT
jgi:HAD superfamily hydrolase (TIGR01509 family)